MQEFDSNYITTTSAPVDATTIKIPEQPSTGLAASTVTTNNTTQDKISMLQESIQGKVARLAGKGVTTVEDKGTQASYAEHPERVNTMSPSQLQEELGAAATYQVLTNPDGSKYQFRHNADGTYAHDDRGEWIKDTVQGNMPVRNAYIDTTKEGNYKFGLARSDVNPEVMSPWTGKPITPFEARYMNQIGKHPYKNGGNEYNGTPGPRGVTPEDGALMDISLPKALADKLEYDIHTNAGQLASRAMGQGPKTDTTTAQFGAGQSEYTTPEAPLWNVNYDMSKAKIAGNTVLPKEVKVYESKDQASNILTLEDIQAMSDKDGTFGEALDVAQSSLMKQWAGSVNALNKVIRSAGKGIGVDEETLNKYVPEKAKIGLFGEGKHTADEYLKDDGTLADKEAGVKASTRVEQAALMKGAEADVANGNYLDATVKTLKAMPTTLGDSTGEMVALVLRAPGLLSAVATRVSNDADTYKENNGKEPDSTWLATSVGTNTIALVTEKLLLKSGIGGVLEKGVSKLGRAGAVAESTVGEGLQEMYDQTQQEYMTQKEGTNTLEDIALSPRTVVAGIAGSTMGGALRGVGEAVGATKDALTGNTKLSPEQKQALETPENTTVKAEDLKTGHTQEDIDNAKDIYHTTKTGGSIQDARDLVQAVDILETNKVKNDSTFKLHEAGKDRHEALGAMLRYALREAYEGADASNQVDMDSADEKFKGIIKGFNLSTRNKKALQEMLVSGVAYGTEGFDTSAVNNAISGMFAMGNPLAKQEETTKVSGGIDTNAVNANLKNMFASMTLGTKAEDTSTKEDTTTIAVSQPEVKEAVKAKVEKAKVEKAKVEKAKVGKPTDEDLGVGTTVEDGYVKGISARTLNRLAGMFDLDVRDVRDSIAFAAPAMQVKKMDAVSKDAAKVQYETYYGDEGILPSYVGFKKAVANGEVDEAVDYVNKIRQAGTRLERELIKHTRAVEDLDKLINNILGKLENGKITKEKAAIALDALDVSVGKKYTLNAMDIAKHRIPEEVQALMDKRKESKVPEVIKAKQEALDMVDAILAHEKIGRDKPVYEKSYVADRVKDFESRIAETKKSIEEQKSEIENAETREDKVVAKKILAKLEKTLAEQEDTLDKYNTKYADVEYTWKEVFNRDKNKTKEEVEAKSGERVGKVTKEQAEELIAQGREVSEDAIAEKRSVTAAKDIAGKVVELTKLREELERIKSTTGAKYDSIKEKISELAGMIGVEGSNLRKTQLSIAKAADELKAYKAKQKAASKELVKAEALEKQLAEAGVDVAQVYTEVGSLDETPTAKVVRGIVNKLKSVADKVKITILQVRRLLANRTAAQVAAELKEATEGIERTQAKLNRLTTVGIAQAKAMNPSMTKAEATKVANAMKTINRLKRMVGWKVNGETGTNKVLDRRDAEVRKVWSKIREIEASLYGTRLVEGNRVTGKENIDRNGNEVSTEIGRMVKYVPTLFGHVPAYDLSELVPEEGGAKDLYKSTILLAAGKMDKAIGGIKNDFTLADSPAMYYMRTANGKIDEQIAAVVALASKEWAAATAKASLMNDNDTIARMIGKLNGSQVKSAERRLLKEGRLLVNEATSLGGKIVSALGIREGDMPIGQYAQLKADFGNYGLSYLKAEGDIEFKTIPAEAWNKVFTEKQLEKDGGVLLVKGRKDKVEYYESLRSKVRDINEALDLHDFAKDYKVTPIKTEGKVYEIENGYSQAPEHNQEILRKLESQKWSVAEGAMDKLMSMNETKVKEYMGWKNLDEMNPKGKEPTHTLEAKEAQESINREVEGNYDAVKSMYTKWKEGSIPKDVYFEWFFSKNGRYMLDSVGVNPQVDKQLARFLVVPKEATETTWNLKDKKDKLYFVSGIMQGLGIDLDNNTTEKLEKIGEDLLALDKKGVEELTQGMLENGEYELNGTKFEVSHIGHTLQALTALEAAAGNERVKAIVTMEFDSKTSGFFHKLMQLPFKDKKEQAKWLAKTGAYVGDTLKTFDEKEVGTNDMMTDEVDSYKTLTKDSDKELKSILAKNSKLKGIIDAIKKAGAMPELVDAKGEVTKEGRNLYKYPFMRFNYAESIQSNRKSMSYDLATQVLEKVVAGKIPYSEDSKEMYSMLGVNNEKDLTELREKLANNDTDKVYIGKVNVSNVLEKAFNESYGAALETVMSNNFGHILEANKLMIASTQIMADAFIAELKKYDTTSGTQKDLDKLIEKYAKVFPQIRAPFTSDRDRGMVIIDTKRAQGGSKWKADTQLPDGKTRTVQALIHEFEAAKAAGAVIPTHWTDGGVIGEVLKQGGVLGIHDAIALGYNGKQIEKMVKDMNRASYEVNRDFNILQNMYTALVESLENVSDEALESIQSKTYNKAGKDDEGMSLREVVEAMREATNDYNKRRAEMYKEGVAVGNIIAYRDTVYRNTEAFEPNGTKRTTDKETAVEVKIRKAVDEELAKCRGK
jgi:hypothetical protein